MKEQLQESRKEQNTPKFTGIRKILRSDLELVLHYSAILPNFWKTSFKTNLNLTVFDIKLLYFF